MIVASIIIFRVIIATASSLGAALVNQIGHTITYYEPVWLLSVAYPTGDGKREQPKTIEFYAFQTTFLLYVRPGTSVVRADAHIVTVNDDGSLDEVDARPFLNRMIEGHLYDEPTSSLVHGTFDDGVLDLVIRRQGVYYYVEPASKYLPNETEFKSIMYRECDVTVDGSHNEDSWVWSYIRGPWANETRPLPHKRIRPQRFAHTRPLGFDEEITQHEVDDDNLPKEARETVCLLYLVADHLYFQSAGKHNFHRTTEEMVKLVRAASDIFSNTIFQDGSKNETKAVMLQVKTIYIHKSQHEPNYGLYEEDLSAELYLQKLAEYDFDGYCLGVGFTFRSFTKRVLGLAYLGDPDKKGTLGGICQERKYLPFRRKSMSYNAAFVTVASRGRPVPKVVSILSLTHELGHSFGSHHDPDMEGTCNPVDGGSYLMSAQSVTGKKRNNRVFSPCSRGEMAAVLRSKRNCFTFNVPVCGNGIPEDFEECDCGHPMQCAETDHCCTPMGGMGLDAECTYRRQEGKTCSPVKDSCCTNNCQLEAFNTQKMCTSLSSCRQEVFCDGKRAQCPESHPKIDWSPCSERTGVCILGECETNVCTIRDKMPSCLCDEDEFKCVLCCKQNDTCRPAHEAGLVSNDGMPLLRPKGSECEDEKVCNSVGDCVDPFIFAEEIEQEDDEDTAADEDRGFKAWDLLVIGLSLFFVVLVLGFIFCIVFWVVPGMRSRGPLIPVCEMDDPASVRSPRSRNNRC